MLQTVVCNDGLWYASCNTCPGKKADPKQKSQYPLQTEIIMTVLSAQNLHQSRVLRASKAPQHASHEFCGFRKLNAVDRLSTGQTPSLQQKVSPLPFMLLMPLMLV